MNIHAQQEYQVVVLLVFVIKNDIEIGPDEDTAPDHEHVIDKTFMGMGGIEIQYPPSKERHQENVHQRLWFLV